VGAEAVSVYEVSPRDGLQNEKRIVPTADKVRLVEALAGAGLRRIEATSFVSPKWIPPLADADDVLRELPRRDGVTYSALVPNARGLERARKAGLSEIAVFLSASETHNRKNINKTVGETLALYKDVVAEARAGGMRVRAYLSTVWGCPYEGSVSPNAVMGIGHELVQMGCYQVAFSDTIGVGNPRQTRELVQGFLAELPVEAVAVHLHDTRGTALANALAALDLGIRTIDASVGGLGGCPYAPGASGNLATEDLVYMLHGMGFETGVDLGKLVEVARLAEILVGRPLPGKVHQAGIDSRRPGRVAAE